MQPFTTNQLQTQSFALKNIIISVSSPIINIQQEQFRQWLFAAAIVQNKWNGGKNVGYSSFYQQYYTIYILLAVFQRQRIFQSIFIDILYNQSSHRLFHQYVGLIQLTKYLHLQNNSPKISFYAIKTILKLLLIFSLNPLPWIQNNYIQLHFSKEISQQDIMIKVNFLLVLASLLRNIIMMVPCICFNLFYNRPRSARIYNIYSGSGKDIYLFASKCIFRDMPYLCIITSFIITVLYFSFSIRLLERNSKCNHQYFSYYENAIWFIMISITTVGFGQVTVCTALGHCITIFSIVIGVFNTSLIVVMSINIFQFSFQEIQTFNALRNQSNIQQYKQNSKKYIRIAIWRLWLKYKTYKAYPRSIQELMLARKLKIIRNQLKTSITVNKNQLFHQMQANFIQIANKSSRLIQNNYKMLNVLNSLCIEEKDLLLSIKYLKNEIKQKKQKCVYYLLMNKISSMIEQSYEVENNEQAYCKMNDQNKISKRAFSIKTIDLQVEENQHDIYL